jgi:hypothetical protein
MSTIALFGAGGKMGCRITDNLRDGPDEMLYVEVSEPGIERLRERGLEATPQAEVVRAADVVILAVPDRLIARIAADIVPQLRAGAMVMCLDPAAPLAGVLPERRDVSIFVTHPCHPPIIKDETDPEARADFFGGVKARQHIVCALMRGPEEHYALGERLARRMFAPVMTAHRVTVEQMAVLEPALSETVAGTCMQVIREAMDEAVACGVPEPAARDFLLGHLGVNVGILFGYIDAQFSDGCLAAIERAKQRIFQPDWKKVFEPENVLAETKAIVGG